ncbi:MAG: site-specific integrase [Acidimicrobiales bacterium]
MASVAEVVEAMSKTPDLYRLPLALAAFCQLRRGEVIGLQRKHIDVDQMTVQIEQSVVVPHKGVATLGPPKSEAGRRTLAIPPNLKQVLIDHLADNVEPEPEAWLFTNETGIRLPTYKFNRVWAKVRADIGRPDLHLHDLRHPGLTWVAASGASLTEIMRRGGHSTPSAAMVYQHATEDRDKALAAALGDLARTADSVVAARQGVSTNAHRMPTEQIAS